MEQVLTGAAELSWRRVESMTDKRNVSQGVCARFSVTEATDLADALDPPIYVSFFQPQGRKCALGS